MLELPSPWSAGCLLVLTATAALSDARAGVIPNWLTLPMLCGAPLVHAAFGGGGRAGSSADALGLALGSALVCALGPLALFAARAMGGGDVKLFAAIGALCGMRTGLEVQLATYAIALAYAGILLCWRRRLLAALGVALQIGKSALTRAPLPHADAMTAIRLGPFVLCASVLLLVRAVLESGR